MRDSKFNYEALFELISLVALERYLQFATVTGSAIRITFCIHGQELLSISQVYDSYSKILNAQLVIL
jgi:hypothetical protein